MKYFFSFVLLFLLYTTATTQSSNKRSKATSLSHVLSKRSFFIATGTLWCGAGNNAAKCEDLGEYEETDKCCREHDACPYTFTFNQPAYNGFYSDKIYSLSHCECDSLFYDCLHEQPYKSNSFVIWESFNSIGVKCFAYLPCSESGEEKDKQEEALWKSLGHRQTGNCSRGSRVAVFDSIFDYYSHLDEQLDLAQRYNVKQQLLTQSERFFSSRKRSFKCNYMFENLPRKMADNFDKNFIRKFAAAGANTTATTTTTTKESGLKTQSSTLAKMTNTNTPSPMKRVRRSAPTIRTDQHGHISLLEYPILVTCLILSFILFIGIYILILA